MSELIAPIVTGVGGFRPDAAARAEKRRRVLALLDEHDATGVLLTSAGVVNWYLDGARTHVSLAADPIVQVAVTRDGDTVHTLDNEHARLVEEELPTDVHVVSRPWFAGVGGASTDLMTESSLGEPLRAARASLLLVERERYAAVCADAASALTDALVDLHPARTEQAVAARVASALLERGLDPLVLLVAGASRLSHRHPLPTSRPIGGRAMVVVCARRHGLIANVSRWVRFGPADSATADATERLLGVEAAFLDAIVPGRSHGAILEEGSAAYARFGFDADEWRRHHQGGAAGYLGRDPRAVPGSTEIAVEYQAFTWNPSAPGVKVEDTVLRTPEGIQILSVDERWPTVSVAGRARPAELQLPG